MNLNKYPILKAAVDMAAGSPSRAALPKSEFAEPNKTDADGHKGGYPIEDRAHAKSALGFAAMHHGKDSAVYRQVAAKIHAKYPDMK